MPYYVTHRDTTATTGRGYSLVRGSDGAVWNPAAKAFQAEVPEGVNVIMPLHRIKSPAHAGEYVAANSDVPYVESLLTFIHDTADGRILGSAFLEEPAHPSAGAFLLPVYRGA